MNLAPSNEASSNPGAPATRGGAEAPNPLPLGSVTPSAPDTSGDTSSNPQPQTPSAPTSKPPRASNPSTSSKPKSTASPAPSKAPAGSGQSDARAAGKTNETSDGDGWGIWPWILTGGIGTGAAAGGVLFAAARRKRS